MLTVSVIVGSLRKDSLNKKLAKALAEIGKDLFTFDFVSLEEVPFFNQDIENNLPESVKALKNSIEKADAVLLVTPEYNRSLPAVLKNAIDWASRPVGKNSLSGKAAATAGVSPGSVGTAVAQSHLRSVLLMLNVAVLGSPEVFISQRPDLFADDGSIGNQSTEQHLRKFLEKFAAWVEKTKP